MSTKEASNWEYSHKGGWCQIESPLPLDWLEGEDEVEYMRRNGYGPVFTTDDDFYAIYRRAASDIAGAEYDHVIYLNDMVEGLDHVVGHPG